MLSQWVEPREYRLRSGEWVPQATIFTEVPGALDVETVVSSRDLRFATRQEARAHSEALGRMAIAQAH
jgi:hypothetical protein